VGPIFQLLDENSGDILDSEPGKGGILLPPFEKEVPDAVFGRGHWQQWGGDEIKSAGSESVRTIKCARV
jgi:hypothetical protein